MAKNWKEMNSGEKLEARFEKWLSPEGLDFKSLEAKSSYQRKIIRFRDAVQLDKTPDRVPIFPFYTFLPADIYGVTNEQVMYDPEKLASTWMRYLEDYRPDYYLSPALVSTGQALDALDYKLYKWPGHGVPPTSPYQCVEKEYMKEDEYDALIEDPSGFWTTRYLPRICGALDGLKFLGSAVENCELPLLAPMLIPYGLPEVQSALKALMKAGNAALSWVQHIGAFEKEAQERGFVNGAGGVAKAPFDVLGDTLRGTQGMMIDMYRHPEKIVKAQERLVPILIKMGIKASEMSGNPIVFMPLHKGADGFMSDEQFKKFYWPFLKEVVMGLIEEGCLPLLFAEGGYNTRLEYLKEIPRGRSIWLFDRTDMCKAKEIVGDTICMAGNVPASLLVTGTAREVEGYCKELIDTIGKNGGFIMSSGTSLDEARPESLRAMIEVTREYGVYK
ncbi:MAG: uroporphyrinogen decarboxylase [Proteobacteria bacterium]|nr:uroporphyrinogen decarboxylase [Pseudomonadota bacterium]MBU2516867.1 uroporphyrinogen decarboxylase [Pseudomonadota bacterium]